MLVSLDGGETWLNAPEGVRVLYEDVDVPGEDEPGEYHLNCTHEGLIQDVWVRRRVPGPVDHNIATDSEMVGEIVARLVEESA